MHERPAVNAVGCIIRNGYFPSDALGNMGAGSILIEE